MGWCWPGRCGKGSGVQGWGRVGDGGEGGGREGGYKGSRLGGGGGRCTVDIKYLILTHTSSPVVPSRCKGTQSSTEV